MIAVYYKNEYSFAVQDTTITQQRVRSQKSNNEIRTRPNSFIAY